MVNNETEKKDHDHTKYINTQEFDKLTSENFVSRLVQEYLKSKNNTANSLKKDILTIN